MVYIRVHKFIRSDALTVQIAKVGMREFRAHLQQYLFTSAPMAIARHGQTIGYYIPTKQHPKKAELA